LLTADTEQIALRTSSGVTFFLGAAGNALFGFIIIAALAVRQPFCASARCCRGTRCSSDSRRCNW